MGKLISWIKRLFGHEEVQPQTPETNDEERPMSFKTSITYPDPEGPRTRR